ncbi:MAG TPA: queuosine precursor transporter [Rhabdochlamydiaceae bacterium]|nr:queuosine precursor transporter [Rhabdochlamydiaceae bacterium]
MNEMILFAQITFIIFFSFAALKIGKEALIALVGLQALMANLFVLKQASFFGFHVTCSDAFAIGSILCLNLLREYFEKESSKKALQICFFTLVFFALMSQIHLFYQPTAQDSTHKAYHSILSSSPRLLLVSLSAFFLGQKLDLSLFQFFKKWRPTLSLTFRSHCCLIVCQLVDTLFFTFFGLFGMVESLSDIMVLSFLIKIILIFSLSPITLFSRRLLSHAI